MRRNVPRIRASALVALLATSARACAAFVTPFVALATPISAFAMPLGVVAGASTLLVLPSVARSDGSRPGAATPIEREQAQTRFLRAKELYDAKDFEKAESEFRASLDIVNSPNARYFVARCLRERGRLVEAYAELGRTVSEAREGAREDGRYTQTADEATADRDALAKQLAFVTVKVARAGDDTVVQIGDHELRRSAWSESIPVAPGQSQVVVRTPQRPVFTEKLVLAAGQHKALSLDAGAAPPAASPPPDTRGMAPAPEPDTTHETVRPFAYVAGGVGLAGMVTFAIAGSMTRSTHSELDTACHGGGCPETYRDTIARGVREQTIANIGLVVGGLGLVTGVSLFLISQPSAKNPSPTALTLTPGGIVLRGSL